MVSCNEIFILEIIASPILDRMWYILSNTKFENTDRRVKALSVLTELSVGSPDKMNLLVE